MKKKFVLVGFIFCCFEAFQPPGCTRFFNPAHAGKRGLHSTLVHTCRLWQTTTSTSSVLLETLQFLALTDVAMIKHQKKATTCRVGQVLRKERCGNACCLIVGGIFIAGIIYINSCRSHSKPLNWTSSPYRTNQHTRLKKSKTSIINWNKFIQSTSVMLAK